MLIKAFLLIAVLAAVTMSAPLLVDPINFEKEWSEWKVKFNKTYESPEEETRRLEIFKDNALKIAEHNAKYVAGQVTWTQGLNQFADLTQEEFSKTYLGTRKLVPNAATAV